MTGTVDRQLNAYIHKLNTVQQKSLLGFIKTILPAKEEEMITIEQYNKELDDADAAIDRGEFYTHEEAKDFLKKIINAGK